MEREKRIAVIEKMIGEMDDLAIAEDIHDILGMLKRCIVQLETLHQATPLTASHWVGVGKVMNMAVGVVARANAQFFRQVEKGTE